MLAITYPDGQTKQFTKPLTVLDAALAISPGLANATLAGKVNNTLVDASYLIEQDCQLSIITDRDPLATDIIRHSCAHLLAQAVQDLFPEAKVTIGPVIEDGFYYDFAFTRSFTPEDLVAIEAQMAIRAKENLPVTRKILSRQAAIELFKQKEEHYKVDIIASIPSEQDLSFYQQGDFIDLCRGPHVPSTNKIKAFKLTKVAGAYWRGDSKNAMLQRIYGTAFANKKELKEHLARLQEAEKRDHRKINKKLNLFHIQEEAPGMVFWHPNGWILYQIIENYIRQKLLEHEYQEVKTPQILDQSLWEKSGHWDKFQQNMFSLEVEGRAFAVKPMNCPCHVQIYKQGLKSYRDLPIRLAEFGSCHRNEPSGSLHGLMRVRHFVQDDAHIFCTEDQMHQEVLKFITLLYEVYQDFGFSTIVVKLSTRPEERVGSDDLWDKAEQALQTALNDLDIEWELNPGEGAFYGPKIEFSLKDCMHRVWQCGTIQVDFAIPKRLEAQYIAQDGSKQTPVMLHRAILGTLERFIGILLEETAGLLPVWLAPVQAVVLNISQNQEDYALEVTKNLKRSGLRVHKDLRNEKIGFKIREHTMAKVPYLIILGDKELSDELISVRTQSGEDLGSMSLVKFVDKLTSEFKVSRS